eukprot:scaffold14015_cov112-Isochrysis_galbana.AAC.10
MLLLFEGSLIPQHPPPLPNSCSLPPPNHAPRVPLALAASSCMASAIVTEKDCANRRDSTPNKMGLVAYT